MADGLEKALSWAEKALEIAGFFLPGIGIIPHLIKLVGFAQEAEPEAAELLNDLHDRGQAAVPLDQSHADRAADTVATIEARRNPQGRGGL